ncbi:MAG: DUF4363 family protein [Oscillospiraceae bacterium]|nr:DUF4363 family protein [Oscillospiraceae bacterium]
MKRMWIGVGLLAAVLIVGICAANRMEEIHQEIAKDLDRAAQSALKEDWDMADALFARAEKTWNKKRTLTSIFSDHAPIEEAESLFAQLRISAQAENEESFATACACLGSLLKAMGESQSLNLRNLL